MAMILFLSCHAEVKLTDVASALRVRPPTVSEVVIDLVRKWWVTKRRLLTDTHAVYLGLSQPRTALAHQKSSSGYAK